MNICGIIAEYNPFHKGHKYQIEQSRKNGATHIAAVMSGSFVQRGEPAIFDKWTRARAALENGVDLVAELPAVYAVSSANRFAAAGVFLLNELQVNMISFGSECGDIDALRAAAAAVKKLENSDEFKEEHKKGISYPKALTNAIKDDTAAQIISQPNNLLAIEYINAIEKINSSIIPFTVARMGALHDGEPCGEFASASRIREYISSNMFSAAAPYLPETTLSLYKAAIFEDCAPVTLKNMERAVLFKLRQMTTADFAVLPDVAEGLENRLYSAARFACNLSEFYESVKTKRYTMARIRRIVCAALLNITADMQSLAPQYIRILGANKRGFEILAACDTSLAHSPKFSDLYRSAEEYALTDIAATDAAALGSPEIQPCGRDFVKNTIILKQ